MHYVKQFNINGVATKQVACIELQGVPNATTEGAVGVLGIDVLSPTHEVYRCVAVNGSVYKWELLSAGMSIMSATSTGEGAATKSFPYSNLLIPSNYLIKVGDLILDSEGYLYQITAISAEACDTMYCGTQIGGIANGDKNCTLVVRDGKLQLVTESGNVVSSVDYFIPDNETVYRTPGSGKGKIIGVKTINDEILRFFVGTKDEYNALTDAQKQNLFAIPMDEKFVESEDGTAYANVSLDDNNNHRITFTLTDIQDGGESGIPERVNTNYYIKNPLNGGDWAHQIYTDADLFELRDDLLLPMNTKYDVEELQANVSALQDKSAEKTSTMQNGVCNITLSAGLHMIVLVAQAGTPPASRSCTLWVSKRDGSARIEFSNVFMLDGTPTYLYYDGTKLETWQGTYKYDCPYVFNVLDFKL